MVTLTASFCQILLKLSGILSDLRLLWIFPLESRYRLFSIPISDQQMLWLFFFVLGGTVILSQRRTTWSLALISFDALLTCIVKLGKWMRSCVLSMTTLLCLMKCNPIMDPVNFLITMKCSAKVWSPLSNLSVTVAFGFSNWPFATWIWELGESSAAKTLAGACCLIMFSSFWAIALT